MGHDMLYNVGKIFIQKYVLLQYIHVHTWNIFKTNIGCCSGMHPQRRCVLIRSQLLFAITWVKADCCTHELHSAAMFYSMFTWGKTQNTGRLQCIQNTALFYPCVDHPEEIFSVKLKLSIVGVNNLLHNPEVIHAVGQKR